MDKPSTAIFMSAVQKHHTAYRSYRRCIYVNLLICGLVLLFAWFSVVIVHLMVVGLCWLVTERNNLGDCVAELHRVSPNP